MATTVLSTARKSLDYNAQGRAVHINEIGYKVISPGIIEGGLLTKKDAATVTVAPFIAMIYDSTYQIAVREETTDPFDIEVTPTNEFIILRENWTEATTSYPSLISLAEGDILETDVIIGRAIFISGTLQSTFDYTQKTEANEARLNRAKSELVVSPYKESGAYTAFVTVSSGTYIENEQIINFAGGKSVNSVTPSVNGKTVFVVLQGGAAILVEGEDDGNYDPPTDYFSGLLIAIITMPPSSSIITGDMIRNIRFDIIPSVNTGKFNSLFSNGALYVIGNGNFYNVTESTTSTSGSLKTSGGLGVAKNLSVGQKIGVGRASVGTLGGIITIAKQTSDSSSDTMLLLSKDMTNNAWMTLKINQYGVSSSESRYDIIQTLNGGVEKNVMSFKRGNVGIGSTNPTSKLFLKQESNNYIGGLSIQKSGGSNTWGLYSDNSNRLHIGSSLDGTTWSPSSDAIIIADNKIVEFVSENEVSAVIMRGTLWIYKNIFCGGKIQSYGGVQLGAYLNSRYEMARYYKITPTGTTTDYSLTDFAGIAHRISDIQVTGYYQHYSGGNYTSDRISGLGHVLHWTVYYLEETPSTVPILRLIVPSGTELPNLYRVRILYTTTDI